MEVLGLDIGGSGIKGALVDTVKGDLISDRHRIEMPENAPPQLVAELVYKIIKFYEYSGPIGCGFPAIVQHGVAYSAANVNSNWIGTNINNLLTDISGQPVYTLNDADAAGVAEMRFGAGKEYQKGVVILLTLGTGIGSAIFTDGVLLPNTEFGHLQIRGKDAEHRASDAVRQNKELSWEKWAKRLQEYLAIMEALFSPDLFIIGGGVSRKTEKYLPLLNLRTRVVPAMLLNQAGIVGAAMYAQEQNS
ncbi:MAG: polyphosphate glucokinase [Chloroflexi bacterium HGW-Chloroflexi-10]|nr:MAG: polyphosphate glucokinase [Chloroflexi bacterium HGW-Chloroflexi-10]